MVTFKKSPKEFLAACGYNPVRNISGKWYGIARMIFTTGLMCDLDDIGPRNGRICFETKADAIRFLESWDGLSAPTLADNFTADKRINNREIKDGKSNPRV